MKKYCVIVAGGAGKRMRTAVPKQFLPLEGKPLLMHTIERFYSFDRTIDITVVLPSDSFPLWRRLLKEHVFSIEHRLVAGGEERFHSVKAGLAHVSGEGLVAVHDGVRPLVNHDTLWRCYADAEEFGNAVPFIETPESVRLLRGDDSVPYPRSQVRLIQTPQVFRCALLLKAYNKKYDPSFTDDATVVEADGVKIHMTHGNKENIKITTPEDMIVAQALFKYIK